MEKRKPHCPLHRVRELAQAGRISATRSARVGAAELGFSFEDMVQVVIGLSLADFYKSMTTYADPTIWQDVYRPETRAGAVYLKLTVVADVVIISFKEL
jgi:motility quorum-sensing regulator/GCU-specific mRNA interferase toxin